MRQVSFGITVAAALALVAGAAGAAGPPSAPVSRCAVDAVVSGAGCMDKYEASVWRVPEPLGANRILVRKIQQGKATAALLAAGVPRSSASATWTTTHRARTAGRTAPTTSTR